MQGALKKHLGLTLKIDKQIFKQRLAKMTAGDFDLVLAGWGPDYNDPLTFGDLFASWNLNNRGRYASPEMDRLIAVAQNASTPQSRMEAFAGIFVAGYSCRKDFSTPIKNVGNKDSPGR